jgi:dihydroorotate dehydrogenase
MYKAIIRPILFLADPEKVHHFVIGVVKFMGWIPGFVPLIRKCMTYSSKRLKIRVAGLEFKNRVGMAAGFDKNADCYKEFSIFGFSFLEIGTVTPLPQPGNVRPRLFRLPDDHALINRMGFNNKGVNYAAKKLAKRNKSIIIGGNIGKNTLTHNEHAAADYIICFNDLYEHVDYLTVNVSCPNIEGLEKLQDQESLREILLGILRERRKKLVRKPVFLKISPDLTFSHIDEIISLCCEMEIDGIIATNTTTARTGLCTIEDRIVQAGTGGLSGSPLKGKTLDIIRYICKQSAGTIPVIGVGGILIQQDAVDMIKAGASLIQIYTGFIYEGPFIVKRLNKAIDAYLLNYG